MHINKAIEIDLGKLLKLLLKRAWLIVLAAVLVGGLTVGVGYCSYRQSYEIQYKAVATMYLKPSRSNMVLETAATRIKTCSAVLTTPAVLEEVALNAGSVLDIETLSEMLRVQTKSGEIFLVSCTGTDAQEAVSLANAAADLLPQKLIPIHGEDSIGLLEAAGEAELVEPTAFSVKSGFYAAVLAAVAVCVVLVGTQLYRDYKASAGSKEK